MKKIIFIIFLLLPLLFSGCINNSVYRQAEGSAWHTLYHITYRSSVEMDDSIRAVIESVDLALSFFNTESDLTGLNKAEREFKAGPMLRDVYTLSRNVWELSDSVFDPTVSPAITAWGFGKGHEVSTDTVAISSLRPIIGFEKTRLSGNYIFKENPKTEFNFSAVAKGYGVDKVAEMLERNGVSDYLIEIGGEIRTSGRNHEGRPWRVAIESPKEEEVLGGEENLETISFTDLGMATSGNYRNFHHDEKGASFGHTISPLTLRPVKSDLLSVTVIAPTCAEADALATASMAMGVTKADKLLNRLGYPALFIVESSEGIVVIRNRSLKNLGSNSEMKLKPLSSFINGTADNNSSRPSDRGCCTAGSPSAE